MPAKGDSSKDPVSDAAGLASTEEILDLKRRAHLLSEENQVLFQQISFLRAQNDKQDEERASKMEEATQKIRQFHYL